MHTTHRLPLATILFVPLIAALVLTLFVWPSPRVGPRELAGAGTIGELLPPGAGGNLLRSTGYFGGAAARGHVGARRVGARRARAARGGAPAALPGVGARSGPLNAETRI